jgi:hypothetical protein
MEKAQAGWAAASFASQSFPDREDHPGNRTTKELIWFTFS